MNQETEHQVKATRVAPLMFGLSVLFVVLLASLIVLWVDIPRVAELSAVGGIESANDDGLDADQITALVEGNELVKQVEPLARLVQCALIILWPLFWVEFVYSRRLKGPPSSIIHGGVFRILACVVPPLRISAPSAAHGGKIWLPKRRWQLPGKDLHKTLEQAFGKPMLIIAMLILPVLLIQFGLNSLVDAHWWLQVLLHVCTGFIWCAFTIEFLIMLSATDKRFTYVKTHWIDLAIILLPLISFLRSLRVLRLARLAKVQKLAKMGRVFRVRGLAMKAMRALMLLGFVNRLLRITPEKRLAKLRLLHKEETQELVDLLEEIDELEAEIAESKAAIPSR
ncbi:MAG: hypothetical protein ACI9UN_002573 [Granulosicoccus sp.]|jgi:hypothetical protein